MRSTETFVPLREELAFIDDYLDIEVVRFSREKLKVEETIDPASLDLMVPSMLLQPLVENCIKHGLSPKIEGGTIRIRSRVTASHLTLEVEDDGVGMSASRESQKMVNLKAPESVWRISRSGSKCFTTTLPASRSTAIRRWARSFRSCSREPSRQRQSASGSFFQHPA